MGRFARGESFKRPEKPELAAEAAVRLSSGISANILDFGIPQKHVLTDMTAMETGCKAGGGGEVQTE